MAGICLRVAVLPLDHRGGRGQSGDMTTTILPLALLLLIAFLGYRAVTGRVADTRDGQDWRPGGIPATARSADGGGFGGGPAVRPGPVRDGGGKSPVVQRDFPVHKVELIQVVGDHHRGDAVLVGERAQQCDH